MPLDRRVLIFDVLAQNRDSNATAGRNKIRFIPKYIFPINVVDVFSKLTPNAAARYRLNVVNELRQVHLRVVLKQQVNMILFPVEFNQLAIPLLAQVGQNLVQPFQHLTRERFAAIFGR
jgi:hypothetical protein